MAKAYRRKDKYTESKKLDDLRAHLDGEMLIAAHIIKQAVDDLADARKGKRFSPGYYPRHVDPLGDLETFFAGDWFDFLADHLGIDPAYIARVMRPQLAPTISTEMQSVQLVAHPAQMPESFQ